MVLDTFCEQLNKLPPAL